MDPHAQYQKAADIADMLLARGYPVISFEVIDGLMVLRFGGARGQAIRADADAASLESIQAAYGRPPPARERKRDG